MYPRIRPRARKKVISSSHAALASTSTQLAFKFYSLSRRYSCSVNMYGSGSTPDCQLGYTDPAHMCGRDCSKEHSQSKRSVSFNSKSRSPTSSSRSGSLSPTDSVEQRLLPLSVINSSSRRLLMASNDRELENSGQSWGSRTTASSYTTPIGDINSDYHGFVGDEDPTFSIISRVSVSSGRL